MELTQDRAVLTQGICYKMKMDLQVLAQIGFTDRDTSVTSLYSRLLHLCGLLYFFYEEGLFLRSKSLLYLGLIFHLLNHWRNCHRIRHEVGSVRGQPKVPFATISYNNMADTGTCDPRAPLA